MKKISIIYLMLFAFLTITSCKKETTTTPVVAPVFKFDANKLCSGNWILTAYTISPGIDFGGVLITDYFSLFDDCEKDDYMKMELNKTGFNDAGATVCDSTTIQRQSWTWSVDASEKVLTNDGFPRNMEQLDATTLKISHTYEGSLIGGTKGVFYKFTETYKH